MNLSSARIGIVDDDQKLVDLVQRYLEKNGFSGVSAMTPPQVAGADKLDLDLLILDIMMPEMDGFELLKRLRRTSTIPVIVLSAKSEVFDRIVGLELGADDYLTKPFEPRELLARIQAILRRKAPLDPLAKSLEQVPDEGKNGSPEKSKPRHLGSLEFEEFSFHLDRQTVCLGKAENQLTTYEFQLLRLFCDNPLIILSRRQIMDWMERNDFGSYDRSIDVQISRLRRKIEKDPARPMVLKTVWGRGYQLDVRKKTSPT